MRKQLGISAALHLAALAALLITIPSLTQELDLSEQIIPVDIVNVADVTNTKISETPTPKPAPTPTKTVAPQPVEQQQPKPPEPPKPPEEKPPEKQPTPDDKAEIIPDKTKPKEEPKKPEPPKPVEKPPEKPKEKPEPPKDALASVLKNIQKLKNTAPTSPTPNPDAEESDKPVTSTAAPAAGQQLSISELDALRRQISQCWNVPSGARGIETMSVELYLEVDENRMPTRVEVVDRGRYVADTFFRTVAESAVRALRNPKCNPLMLPPDKYSEWSKIRMTFNPKDMM